MKNAERFNLALHPPFCQCDVEQMKRGIKAQKDKFIHSKSDFAEIAKARLGLDISTCPCCKTGRMVIVMQFGANAPPVKINDQRKQIESNDK